MHQILDFSDIATLGVQLRGELFLPKAFCMVYYGSTLPACITFSPFLLLEISCRGATIDSSPIFSVVRCRSLWVATEGVHLWGICALSQPSTHGSSL